MGNPRDCKYTKDHEWVKLEGDIATTGVTNYAATQLGDMVYVEMPEKGTKVKQGIGQSTRARNATRG